MMIEDRPNGLPPCLRLVPWLRAFLVDLLWQSRSNGDAELLVELCYFALRRLPHVIGTGPIHGDRNLVLVQIDRDGNWPDVVIEYRLSSRMIDVLSLTVAFHDDRDPPPGSWTSPGDGGGGADPDPRISRCGREAPFDGFVNQPPPPPFDGHVAVFDHGGGVADRVVSDSTVTSWTSDEIVVNSQTCCICSAGGLGSRSSQLWYDSRTAYPWPPSAIAPPS